MDESIIIPPEFFNRVREALHRRWDPIGVSALTDTFGEYDAYVGPVCQLLLAARDTDAIFAALWRLETEGMGLRGDRDGTQAFAHWLVDHANTPGAQDALADARIDFADPGVV